jgi:lycopene cyclase domain-containing protein
MTYTGLAFIAAAVSVALDVAVLRTRLVTRRVFWTAYVIVLAFQLAANGVLTGFRIVRYDPSTILGSGGPSVLGDWHLIFAPVEDVLFGFALVLQTLAWWVFWGRRGVQR